MIINLDSPFCIHCLMYSWTQHWRCQYNFFTNATVVTHIKGIRVHVYLKKACTHEKLFFQVILPTQNVSQNILMVKFECKAGRILFSKLHSSTILQGARNEPLTTGAYLFPIHGAWSIYGLGLQFFLTINV